MKKLTYKAMKEERLINKMWEAVETIEKNLLLNTETYFTDRKNIAHLSGDLDYYYFPESKKYFQRYKTAIEKTHKLQNLINDFIELVAPDDYLEYNHIRHLYYPYDNEYAYSLDNVPSIIWAIKRTLYYYNEHKDNSVFKLLSERVLEKHDAVTNIIDIVVYIEVLAKIIEDVTREFSIRFIDPRDDEDLPF